MMLLIYGLLQMKKYENYGTSKSFYCATHTGHLKGAKIFYHIVNTS